MLDTVGFNSSTLYRYATVNVDALREELQDDEVTVEAVAAFVKAFVRSMPSGKQNTFANRTLPEDVVVALRDTQPINASSAFEVPIKARGDESISRQAIERLGQELSEIANNYDEKPSKAWAVLSGGPVEAMSDWSEQVTLPELEAKLREALTARFAE